MIVENCEELRNGVERTFFSPAAVVERDMSEKVGGVSKQGR